MPRQGFQIVVRSWERGGKVTIKISDVVSLMTTRKEATEAMRTQQRTGELDVSGVQ